MFPSPDDDAPKPPLTAIDIMQERVRQLDVEIKEHIEAMKNAMERRNEVLDMIVTLTRQAPRSVVEAGPARPPQDEHNQGDDCDPVIGDIPKNAA